MTGNESLNDRQSRFVEEYLVDLNATQAAIRAGYSEASAKQIACELMGKPEIQDAVAAAMLARSRRTEVTQDRVVKELAKVAFSSIKSFAEWTTKGATWKPSTEISEEDAACISEVTESLTKESITLKLKLHDKIKALELLGRHIGMFGDERPKDGEGQKTLALKYRLDDKAVGE